MRQRRHLGAVCVAILAFVGIATTLAQAAEPNILPEGTAAAPLTAESSSGTATFGSSILEVSSAKSKGTLSLNSAKLGSFQAMFEESKNVATGVKCTGLNSLDGTGVILVQGTFHIRDYKEAGALKTAAVLLLLPVHFSCGPTLVIVLGCVAAAITPESTLATTLTGTLAVSGKDNKIITVLNEANSAEELCQLLFATEGGATFKLGSFLATATAMGFKKGGAAVEVLVMPL
jgi:hypothetical protein